MKKKLEAELISIAHRILKLKNRAELDQLQQETLKLYEKISVLRFVEDNFNDVKPTIGHASAEETLEEIYGLEEEPAVHANEVEAKEEKAREEKKAEEAEKAPEEKSAESSEVASDKEEASVSEKEKAATAEHSDEELPGEETGEPKTSDAEEEPAVEEAEEEVKEEEVKEEAPEAEEKPEEPKEEKIEEPTVKVEVEKPAEEIKAMEAAAAAVFEKEDESTIEEEEKAADAEIVTIEPDPKTKVEDSGLSFDFAFERPAAPEEPVKQKEITFEDYKDYKEPEFIKKEDVNAPEKTDAPKEADPAKEEGQATPEYKDWRDWEPAKSAEAEAPKAEAVPEPPKQEAPKEEPKAESSVRGNIATRSDFERPKSLNDSLGKSISLGLNDRIAFEKNLFSGSTDDLNRVLSQLNTMHTFDEAKDFIENLVKPDYNNWEGKEEYEERFMAIVEKKFN